MQLAAATSFGGAVSPLAAGGGVRMLGGMHDAPDAAVPLALAFGVGVDFDESMAAGGAPPRASSWQVASTRVRVEAELMPWTVAVGPVDCTFGFAFGAGIAVVLHDIVVGERHLTPFTLGPAARVMPQVGVRLGPGSLLAALPLDVVVDGADVGGVHGRAPVAGGGLLGYRLDL